MGDTATGAACPHALFSGESCGGRATPTGYCDTCGRHPGTARAAAPGTDSGRPAPPSPVPARGPSSARTPSSVRASPQTVALPLLTLPWVEPRSPADKLVPEDSPAPPGKKCGNPECEVSFRPPLVELPLPNAGFCPSCGTPFSFAPSLHRGDSVAQYRVRGCLAHGGQGWVYLADNAELARGPDGEADGDGDGTGGSAGGGTGGGEPPLPPVVMKGLLNRHDERMRKLATEEARYLYQLSHDGVVGFHNYLRHQHPGDAEPTSYLVMEYVGGPTLDEIVTETRKGKLPLGRELDVETVLTYGCLVLEALGDLHPPKLGLVYSDLKPSNVIHVEDKIKIIDLGGVRRAGDQQYEPTLTEGYAAPEVLSGRTGPTVAHDLHTVGRTLREMAAYAVRRVPGLGMVSFTRAIDRAIHPLPHHRFSSAREMALQLRGVAREIRALRGIRDDAEPSAYFAPAGELLGRGLGTVPPRERWLRGPAPSRADRGESAPLDPGVPSARAFALGLPVPIPHRDDPREWEFGLTTYSPGQILHQDEKRPSAEVCLHHVRRHLARGGPGSLRAAGEEFEAAVKILGAGPALRWRLAWHQGLLALARADEARRTAEARAAEQDVGPGAEGGGIGEDGDGRDIGEDGEDGDNGKGAGEEDELSEQACLEAARRAFDLTYTALPGEYAPKLALGYCAERLAAFGRTPSPPAEDFYRAVWARNPSHVSAAFGLVRLALARGARQEALAVLDAVPGDSHDYAAARIAAVRVQAARLADADPPLPAPAGFEAAQRRLTEDLDDQDLRDAVHMEEEPRTRLKAEVLEWALDLVRSRTGPVWENGADGENREKGASGASRASQENGQGTGGGYPYGEIFGPPPDRRGRGRRSAGRSAHRAADRAARGTTPLGSRFRRWLGVPGPTPEVIIRAQLAACYSTLAKHSRDFEEHERFADRANAVRPTTLI